MKNLFFTLLPGIIFIGYLNSQTPVSPGGVIGIKGWYVSESLSSWRQVSWKDQLSGSNHPFLQNNINHSVFLLNFNPAVCFQYPLDGISMSLGTTDLDQITLFVVYQLNDTLSEKKIWTWSKNGNQNLLLTSRFLLDCISGDSSAIQVPALGNPVIGAYLHRREKDTIPVLEQFLKIGGTSFSGESQIFPFLGKVAEVIWYDRVLSGEEKQKVESYLAIKYGIPLSQAYQPSSYLNSKGDVVWDAKKNQQFIFNITGIGRDDQSGLCQMQSTCAYSPGLLTIGVGNIEETNAQNKARLEDMNFLIWSDNNLDLEPGPQLQGQPTQFLRQWRITRTAGMQNAKTLLQFDTKQAESQPGEGETWWLIIDRSGTGSYPLGAVDCHAMDDLTADKFGRFQGILWDTDNSGIDNFSLSIAPYLISKVWITPPVCSPPSDGTLHIGAEGGRPPYQFSLRNSESGYSFSWSNTNNFVSEISGIQPGEYKLTIRDSENGCYEEVLFIQSSDAPVSNLQSNYTLLPGQTLDLDASQGIQEENISYHWIGPDGLDISSPEIRISSPGAYFLFMDRDGCISKQKITVTRFEESNFKQLILFPNPVAVSHPFSVIVQLHRDATVEMEISDIMGTLKTRKTLKGNNFYRLEEQYDLPPGIYSVSFRSENSVQSLKLVIE